MLDKTAMLLRQAAAAVISFSLVALTAGCAIDKGPVAPPVNVPPTAMAERVITDVATNIATEGVVVSIQGSSILTYTSVKQSLPLGVVLYFPDASFDASAVQPAVENGVVQNIEISQQQRATRLKILLKEDAEYRVVRQGNGLNVVFSMGDDVMAEAPENVSGMEAASVAMTVEAEDVAFEVPEAAPTVSMVGPGTVSRIDFTSTQTGASTILIGTTAPVAYTVSKKNETTLYLKLSNTRLPDSRKRPIITTRFNSAVNRILPIQTDQMGGDTLFLIELRDAVPYLVTQRGNEIEVSLDPSTVPPVKEDDAKLPAWKKAITEAEAMVVADVDAATTAVVEPEVIVEPVSLEPVIYVGETEGLYGRENSRRLL